MAFVRKSCSNGVVDCSSEGSSVVKQNDGEKGGQKNIIQIYTDWANHYLEKGGFRGRISSLHADVVDGTLISDVIEAITGKPVSAIDRHPETKEQQIENIRQCLTHLRSLHVVLEDIDPGHIAEGKLKPILSLFFQLSRHKQQLQQLKKKSGGQARSGHGQVTQVRLGHAQITRSGHSGLAGHIQMTQTSQLVANQRQENRLGVSSGKTCVAGAALSKERQQFGENRVSSIQKPSSNTINTSTGISNHSGAPSRLNGASGRSLTPNSNHSPRVSAHGSHVPSLRNSSGSKLGSASQLRDVPAGIGGLGPCEGLHKAARPGDRSHGAIGSAERSLAVTNYGVVSRNSGDGNLKSQLSYSGKRDSSSSGVSSTRSSYSNGTDTASESPLAEPEIKSTALPSSARLSNNPGGLVRKSAVPTSAIPQESSGKSSDHDSSTLQRSSGRSMLQQPRSRVARSAAPPSSGGSIAVSTAKRRSLVGSQSSLASTSSVGSGIGGASVASRSSNTVSGKSTLPRQQRRFGNGRSTNVALVSPMPHVTNGIEGSTGVRQQQDIEKTTAKSRQLHPATSTNGLVTDDSLQDPDSRVPTQNNNNRRRSDSAARKDTTKSTSSAPSVNGSNPGAGFSSEGASSAEDVCSVRPMKPLLRLGRLEYGRSISSPANKHHFIGSKPAAGYVSDTEPLSQHSERRVMTSIDPGRPGSLTDGYVSEGGGGRLVSVQHSNRKLPQLRYSSGDAAEWRDESASLPRAAADPSKAASAALSSTIDQDANLSAPDVPQPPSADISAADKPPTDPASDQLSHWNTNSDTTHLQPPVDLSRDLDSLSLPGAGSDLSSQQQSANAALSTAAPKTLAVVRRGSASLEKHISAAGWYSSLPSENQLLNGHHRSSKTPSEGGSTTPSRPRTRFKISDSTQTEPSFSGRHLPAHRQQPVPSAAKSHSVSGAAAQQLSLSFRQQLRGEATGSRPVTTGSLAESPYAGYMHWRCQAGIAGGQRPNSAYTAHVAAPPSHHSLRGCLTDAESIESMGCASSDILPSQQQQQQHQLLRSSPAMSPQLSSSAAGRQLANISWESGQYQSPKLYRSNSIRSTKSEQVYSSLIQQQQLQRQWQQNSSSAVTSSSVDDPIYGHLSMEPSSHADSFHQLSPTRCNGSIARANTTADDVRGSSQSLASNTSSIYSSHEDKVAVETRRLRRELTESQQKVQSLTNQLNTNAHVVEAFEQSLASMTKKMHALSATNDQKDRQIAELRRSLNSRPVSSTEPSLSSSPQHPTRNHPHHQHHQQHASTESLSSISSTGSSHSQQQQQQQGSTQQQQQAKLPLDREAIKKKKKKGWFAASPQLRSSFGKAFTRRKSRAFPADCEETDTAPDATPTQNHTGVSGYQHDAVSQPDEHTVHGNTTKTTTVLAGQSSCSDSIEQQLRRELQLKDSALTELRLQTLSAHNQLESLRESAAGARREMALVRQDNERLQQLLASRCLSPAASPVSPSSGVADITTANSADVGDCDEDDRVLAVLVLPDAAQVSSDAPQGDRGARLVGHVRIGRTTSWTTLDERLAMVFREYMTRVDPTQSMAVGWEAALQYQLADLTRPLSSHQCPDLLPWGYVIGDVTQLFVTLTGHRQGALDAFIFENLIPRAVAHRFVSLLMERRRVILGGQSGTGKTFLARQLAEHVVASCGDGSISSFTVQPSGEQQLQQFLDQLLAASHRQTVTQVVIIDDLHHVTSSEETMASLASESRSHSDIYIIGTSDEMSAPSSLPPSIGWLPCVCHMEPASGLLSRYLRRKLVTASLASSSGAVGNQSVEQQMTAVLEWIPRVWKQLNSFIELHCSPDVTIGPCALLDCPYDLLLSQQWFCRVWNSVLVPHVRSVVRHALLTHGRRASWHDPVQFVADSYPWQQQSGPAGLQSLSRLPAEQVGYHVDGATTPPQSSGGQGEEDPLLDMLRSLQQAAEYSGPGYQYQQTNSTINSTNTGSLPRDRCYQRRDSSPSSRSSFASDQFTI